jgi:hypothetical protein
VCIDFRSRASEDRKASPHCWTQDAPGRVTTVSKRDGSLTDRPCAVAIVGRVKDFDDRVVVVRVWWNAGQLVIRVITSSGPTCSGRGWVYTDVDAASERIGQLLREFEE